MPVLPVRTTFQLFVRSYLRLRRCEIFCVALVVLPLLLSACPTFAQTGNTNPPPAATQAPDGTSSGDAEPVDNPKYLIKHLAQDQVAIWTGPFKMKASDLKWVVPFAGITTGLIMSDRTASHEASRVS